VTTETSTSVLEGNFAQQIAAAIEAAPIRDLDALSKHLWAAHGAGAITDDQAQQLAELIQRERGGKLRTRHLGHALGSVALVAASPRIQRSPDQRSPDRRASIKRRREHAATGPLPPAIAAGFTTGQLAVLRVVADEWLAHGVCDRSRNEIAARAGVSLTIVKQALWLAEHADHLVTIERRPRSGRKHLTNLIRIVRAEWLDWLAKGRRKAYAVNACNRAKPIFPQARGAQNNPPRSQDFRNSGSERVDKTGEKGNRSAASRGTS
jgi:hypothetical protein